MYLLAVEHTDVASTESIGLNWSQRLAIQIVGSVRITFIIFPLDLQYFLFYSESDSKS